MSEKCCGNCRFFGSEDLGGHGECQLSYTIRYCRDSCISYRPLFDSWTEITSDNVEELYDKPIAVAWKHEGKTYYSLAGDCTISLATMAKCGGYWYYVLPELKIE